jgi:CheY-like chemotaxis protein
MTAHSDNRLVRDGVREGAVAVLSKPLDIEAILSLFSSLRIKRSIAVVDDDPEFCTAVEDILRKRGFSVTAYTDPLEALKTFDETIHMILLSMNPGGDNGLDTLRKIRERYSHVPVTLVAGSRKEMKESLGAVLATGVHTCLYKPLQTEALLQAVTEMYHRDLAGILPIWKKRNRNKE